MITRGVYSATCSILNNDYSLNVDATIAHAASTINNGLHGAIFFGSTGQSQLISISEKKDLIAKIASHKLRKQFFLGTGCNSSKETIDLIKYGFEYGFKDFLIMPPAYTKVIPKKAYLIFTHLSFLKFLKLKSFYIILNNLVDINFLLKLLLNFLKLFPIILLAAKIQLLIYLKI